MKCIAEGGRQMKTTQELSHKHIQREPYRKTLSGLKPLFGIEYVQGYTAALMDAKETFRDLIKSEDMKIHKRRMDLKNIEAIFDTMIDGRAILREHPDAFVRCKKDGGYEIHRPNKR